MRAVLGSMLWGLASATATGLGLWVLPQIITLSGVEGLLSWLLPPFLAGAVLASVGVRRSARAPHPSVRHRLGVDPLPAMPADPHRRAHAAAWVIAAVVGLVGVVVSVLFLRWESQDPLRDCYGSGCGERSQVFLLVVMVAVVAFLLVSLVGVITATVPFADGDSAADTDRADPGPLP